MRATTVAVAVLLAVTTAGCGLLPDLGPSDEQRAARHAQRACAAANANMGPGTRDDAVLVRNELDKAATLAAKAATLDPSWKSMAGAFSDLVNAWGRFITAADAKDALHKQAGFWLSQSRAMWAAGPDVPLSTLDTLTSACRLADAADQ
jgi:hypothetical protein